MPEGLSRDTKLSVLVACGILKKKKWGCNDLIFNA